MTVSPGISLISLPPITNRRLGSQHPKPPQVNSVQPDEFDQTVYTSNLAPELWGPLPRPTHDRYSGLLPPIKPLSPTAKKA